MAFAYGLFWHQNIIQLAYMSNNIDLYKLSLQDIFIPYIEANMQIESYRDIIRPGQGPFDLIHSDVFRPYITRLYRTIYNIIFLCYVIKQYEAIFLKKKNGNLSTVN